MSREATRKRSQTQTTEAFDDEFADELEQMEYYSHGDAVDVKVVSVDRVGDSVEVVFSPPVGDQFERRWDAPRTPGHETMFTALLEHAGYNLSTADEIIGDRVPFTYEEDGWTVEVEEPTAPIRERLTDRFRRATFEDAAMITGIIGGIVVFPLTAPFIVLHSLSEDGDAIETFLFSLVGLLMWAFGVMLMLIGLSGAG